MDTIGTEDGTPLVYDDVVVLVKGALVNVPDIPEFGIDGDSADVGEKAVVLVAFGAGDTGVGLVAASSAFACKSLSPPANMIPDSVPVKNVAIGIIISKNFWSIGLIAFNG